jgi:hypothetical protein
MPEKIVRREIEEKEAVELLKRIKRFAPEED